MGSASAEQGWKEGGGWDKLQSAVHMAAARLGSKRVMVYMGRPIFSLAA